jgi:tRNA (Thr-GGU) A37 N-methylase
VGVSGSAELRFVGVVESSLADKEEAPKQPDEGAPPPCGSPPSTPPCCKGLHAGDRALVLTWLDRADREVQGVHPRATT